MLAWLLRTSLVLPPGVLPLVSLPSMVRWLLLGFCPIVEWPLVLANGLTEVCSLARSSCLFGMGMAGWVRMGRGALRALPAASESETGFEAEDIASIGTEIEVSQAEAAFGLYPDLADMIAQDGGLGDLPEEPRPERLVFEVVDRGWLKHREN